MIQNDTKTQSMYELVEQWQQSGKTQKQFSEENSIKLATFIYWVQKHRQSNAPDVSIRPTTGSELPEKLELEILW